MDNLNFTLCGAECTVPMMDTTCTGPVVGTVTCNGRIVGEYEVSDQEEYEALIRAVAFARLEALGHRT